jgi:hypothetical protein
MAKIGKPHIWAAGWMFLCLQYAFDFKISQRTRSLVLSGVFFGVALGTATSQWIFTPFLIWANWDRHFWIYVKRCFISFGVAGLVYLMLNPTLPFHFQDFMDEARFLSNWYPFKVRASSIPDYYFYMVRLGLGNISFISAMAAVIFLFWKGRERIMKEWAVTLIICLALAAFQVQALSKDPLQVRLSLAGLGFLCYLAVWFTFQFPWGRYLRWAMLLTLLGYGILYNRHFQSDCAPNDNASVASLWIQKNIPKGTVIEHMYSIPTADQFPPIDVNSYKIVAYDPNSRAEQDKFLIMNPMNFHIHDELLAAGYTLEQRFENSPLQRRGLTDHFTNANFPVLIYRKNGTANGRASGPSFLPPTRNFSS